MIFSKIEILSICLLSLVLTLPVCYADGQDEVAPDALELRYEWPDSEYDEYLEDFDCSEVIEKWEAYAQSFLDQQSRNQKKKESYCDIRRYVREMTSGEQPNTRPFQKLKKAY